ncbi:hypothetical protein ABEB36_009131 [Hypothenemus hampei]|uniref:Uncharacterized protein n=1 Tax=Hypothenemus hampei TaxID=57062 RepID=A0ABD1ES84_HYPHA
MCVVFKMRIQNLYQNNKIRIQEIAFNLNSVNLSKKRFNELKNKINERIDKAKRTNIVTCWISRSDSNPLPCLQRDEGTDLR